MSYRIPFSKSDLAAMTAAAALMFGGIGVAGAASDSEQQFGEEEQELDYQDEDRQNDDQGSDAEATKDAPDSSRDDDSLMNQKAEDVENRGPEDEDIHSIDEDDMDSLEEEDGNVPLDENQQE